jgi:hypothetical protein
MQLVAAPRIYPGKRGGVVVPSGSAAPGKMPQNSPSTFKTLSHAVVKRISQFKRVGCMNLGRDKCRFISRREHRIYSPRARLVDDHFFLE